MDKLANDKKHINLIIQIIFLVLIGITALKVLLVGHDIDDGHSQRHHREYTVNNVGDNGALDPVIGYDRS